MFTTPHDISLDKPYEVRHWMRVLNCTEGDLYTAVRAVGKGLAELRRYQVETGPSAMARFAKRSVRMTAPMGNSPRCSGNVPL